MTILTGNDEFITSGTVTWGCSAPNVRKTFNVAKPGFLSAEGRYRITARNSGTSSAVTITIMDRESLGASGTFAELTRFALGTAGASVTPGNSGRVILVQGWLLGDKNTSGTVGRLYLTNDKTVPTAKSPVVQIRIRKC